MSDQIAFSVDVVDLENIRIWQSGLPEGTVDEQVTIEVRDRVATRTWNTTTTQFAVLVAAGPVEVRYRLRAPRVGATPALQLDYQLVQVDTRRPDDEREPVQPKVAAKPPKSKKAPGKKK